MTVKVLYPGCSGLWFSPSEDDSEMEYLSYSKELGHRWLEKPVLVDSMPRNKTWASYFEDNPDFFVETAALVLPEEFYK